MTQADANYLNSGDPYEIDTIGTTPVGFYDGMVHDGFSTSSNANYYAIADLSGNVAEWGTGDGYIMAYQYPVNGGAWNESSGMCNSVYNHGALWDPYCKTDAGGGTGNWLGLRVVRSTP